MTVYLDEDMVAEDANEIIFPHLLLCAGVVCLMQDDTLIGCHISSSTTEDAVLAELATQVGNSASTMRTLYIITDFDAHFQHSNLSFTDKAARIGFVGDMRIVNANPIQTGDGVYARVTSLAGAGICQVFVEPDQNARPYQMTAAAGYGGPVIALARNGLPSRVPPFT